MSTSHALPGSIVSLIESIKASFNDDRCFDARDGLVKCKELADAAGCSEDLMEFLQSDDQMLIITAHVQLLNEALDLVRNDSSGWHLLHDDQSGSRQLQIWHRAEGDSPVHGFKVSATLRAPAQALLALISEIDLYSTLFPFLSKSREVLRPGRARRVANVVLKAPWPIANRDFLMYGFACDGLDAVNNCVPLVLRSIDAARPYPYASELELPPCDTGDVRAHVQYGAALFTPLSFEATRFECIAHVDPRLISFPPTIVNWFVSQVIRVGVYMLERRAAAVALNLASPTPPPTAPQSTLSSLVSRVYSSTPPDDAHAHRIRSDRKFYGWLERRFADYMHGVVGLQAAGGTGNIWQASDLSVLGSVEGQDNAGDSSCA